MHCTNVELSDDCIQIRASYSKKNNLFKKVKNGTSLTVLIHVYLQQVAPYSETPGMLAKQPYNDLEKPYPPQQLE